jgi:tRNA uridine 5-carboxymethylaminomethyl modification enzyme
MAINELRLLMQTSRHQGITIEQWIRRPENTISKLPEDIRRLASELIWFQAETDCKYEGYIKREMESVARQRRQDEQTLPSGLDYAAIPGLRNESRQKLSQIRPATLGQASRISGVTPADLSLLSVWLRKSRGGEKQLAEA